ncbi:MAG: hypothetical protein ACKVJU_15040 [Verrucomicrobiales bacterium]
MQIAVNSKQKQTIGWTALLVAVLFGSSFWIWTENRMPLPNLVLKRIHKNASEPLKTLHHWRWEILQREIREETEKLEITGATWRNRERCFVIGFGKDGKIRWVEKPDATILGGRLLSIPSGSVN